MIHSLLQNHRKKLEKICRDYAVQSLHVFGSAVRSDFAEMSDIDLLVCFSPESDPSLSRLVTLQIELEKLFGRRIDIVTESVFANPYRRAAIKPELELLYAA